MEANSETINNYFKNINDLLSKPLDGLHKSLDEFQKMMPKTMAKKVKIKGKIATVYKQVNGHIAINFETQADADTFFNSLK